MPSHSVKTTDEQERVLRWEAGNRKPPITTAELVQGRIDNYISERKGHYDDPREVLKRMNDADRGKIPSELRKKLGITDG
jgi:hypothetical protein